MNETPNTGRDDGFFEVVHRQRACRAFTDEAVPDALVAKVLDAATHAPSAENRQPWVFVVVRDPARRRAIGDVTRKAWEGGGRAHSEKRLSPAFLEEVDRGATGSVAAAPVIIVVGGDSEVGDPRVLDASIFPAVQNLLLAATALGLGSALTTLPLVFGDELKASADLPQTVRPMAVVPLGWPKRPVGPPRRIGFEQKAYRDSYGRPW